MLYALPITFFVFFGRRGVPTGAFLDVGAARDPEASRFSQVGPCGGARDVLGIGKAVVTHVGAERDALGIGGPYNGHPLRGESDIPEGPLCGGFRHFGKKRNWETVRVRGGEGKRGVAHLVRGPTRAPRAVSRRQCVNELIECNPHISKATRVIQYT